MYLVLQAIWRSSGTVIANRMAQFWYNNILFYFKNTNLNPHNNNKKQSHNHILFLLLSLPCGYLVVIMALLNHRTCRQRVVVRGFPRFVWQLIKVPMLTAGISNFRAFIDSIVCTLVTKRTRLDDHWHIKQPIQILNVKRYINPNRLDYYKILLRKCIKT